MSQTCLRHEDADIRRSIHVSCLMSETCQHELKEILTNKTPRCDTMYVCMYSNIVSRVISSGIAHDARPRLLIHRVLAGAVMPI
eukprot:COSAG01_NODE_9482_length_2435_cov_1.681079_4_plen_84_part_00